ncbi:MAG TPA: hypothetical protein VE974_10910 [Thermoanaerobaculia bacterium]|nr:hypothetical protein [Thermoanaerobaculia bacterium]
MPNNALTQQLVNELLGGNFQYEGRGHLSHPLVKFLFVFLPLGVASVATLLRFYDSTFSADFLLLSLLIILTCQSLDFRADRRGPTARWVIGLAVSGFVVAANRLGMFSIEDWLAERIGASGALTSGVAAYVALVLLLFLAAARGTLRVCPSDVLWIRKYLSRWAFLQYAYVTVAVTYYVVSSTIDRRVGEAWWRARGKAALVRTARGRKDGGRVFGLHFVDSILMMFDELARDTNAILIERGFLQVASVHDLPADLSPEDIAAIIICVVFVAVWIGVSVV